MDNPNKVIGITMRVVEETNYDEQRDALAHNWAHFLAWSLGDDVSWIPIPNIGSEAVLKFAQVNQLDGLILSGGNDVGESPLRDETETALINFAVTHQLPIIGVCRGMQMLWQHFGGSLKPVDIAIHKATKHQVNICANSTDLLPQHSQLEVNSFHTYGLSERAPSPKLMPFARTDNGDIEAVIWPEVRIFAMMWHPEREQVFSESDKRFFRWALLREDE